MLTVLLSLALFLTSCSKPCFKIAPGAPLYDRSLTVAALPFAADPSCDDAGEYLSDLIRTELVPYYRVVERRQIQHVVEEHGLTLTGLMDEKTIAEIGELLSVKALILGRITSYEDASGGEKAKISADIRMVDAGTGEYIWSLNLTCASYRRHITADEYAPVFAGKFIDRFEKEIVR